MKTYLVSYQVVMTGTKEVQAHNQDEALHTLEGMGMTYDMREKAKITEFDITGVHLKSFPPCPACGSTDGGLCPRYNNRPHPRAPKSSR